MIDKVIGNYRILEKVGEGGMGDVYRALDLMLDREVAIKAIRPELARDPEIVERFRAEARMLARVNHPTIATIYSFFVEGEDLFLAMEFVRGQSLARLLHANGALPWEHAVPLLAVAFEGIEQAHRAGIVHRDLKPDNLMITGPGAVKVMDFGIARLMGSGRLTRTGLLVGTLRYMAPEQIRGEEVDRRTDVYALGIVLYETVAGRVPFDAGSDYAVLKAQVEEYPAPPSAAMPGLPPWLDRAILKALAKDPAERFQTVDELRRFLLGRGSPTAAGIDGGIGGGIGIGVQLAVAPADSIATLPTLVKVPTPPAATPRPAAPGAAAAGMPRPAPQWVTPAATAGSAAAGATPAAMPRPAPPGPGPGPTPAAMPRPVAAGATPSASHRPVAPAASPMPWREGAAAPGQIPAAAPAAATGGQAAYQPPAPGARSYREIDLPPGAGGGRRRLALQLGGAAALAVVVLAVAALGLGRRLHLASTAGKPASSASGAAAGATASGVPGAALGGRTGTAGAGVAGVAGPAGDGIGGSGVGAGAAALPGAAGGSGAAAGNPASAAAGGNRIAGDPGQAAGAAGSPGGAGRAGAGSGDTAGQPRRRAASAEPRAQRRAAAAGEAAAGTAVGEAAAGGNDTEAAEPDTASPAGAAEPDPRAGGLPTGELSRLGAEIDKQSDEIRNLYAESLSHREKSGGGAGQAEERLKDELKEFQSAAERFHGQFESGFFTRTRIRLGRLTHHEDARAQIVRMARALAASGERVDGLIANVKPDTAVRQLWHRLRREWQRVAALCGL